MLRLETPTYKPVREGGSVGRGDPSGVAVTVGLGGCVDVDVAVSDGVTVAVSDGLTVAVAVAVVVAEKVGAAVAVCVNVGVGGATVGLGGVRVAVGIGEAVRLGVAVSAGTVESEPLPQAQSQAMEDQKITRHSPRPARAATAWNEYIARHRYQHCAQMKSGHVAKPVERSSCVPGWEPLAFATCPTRVP
jgi:hypothetical protein